MVPAILAHIDEEIRDPDFQGALENAKAVVDAPSNDAEDSLERSMMMFQLLKIQCVEIGRATFSASSIREGFDAVGEQSADWIAAYRKFSSKTDFLEEYGESNCLLLGGFFLPPHMDIGRRTPVV